jgi:hypothetical protein
VTGVQTCALPIFIGFEVQSALDEDPVLVGCKYHCGW